MKKPLFFALLILGIAGLYVAITSYPTNASGATVALIVSIAAIVFAIKKRPAAKRIEPEPTVNQPPEPVKIDSDPSPKVKSVFTQEAPRPKYTAKNFSVAGVSFRKNEIESLAVENPDYDLTKKEILDAGIEESYIWEYEFFPTKVEIVPEPDNPKDGNALKVIVDGQHVGYIKKGSCSQVRNLLKSEKLIEVDVTIGGGRYKYVWEDDDGKYQMEKGEKEYSVKVNIMLRNE